VLLLEVFHVNRGRSGREGRKGVFLFQSGFWFLLALIFASFLDARFAYLFSLFGLRFVGLDVAIECVGGFVTGSSGGVVQCEEMRERIERR
jgi:hypothetical protein